MKDLFERLWIWKLDGEIESGTVELCAQVTVAWTSTLFALREKTLTDSLDCELEGI